MQVRHSHAGTYGRLPGTSSASLLEGSPGLATSTSMHGKRGALQRLAGAGAGASSQEGVEVGGAHQLNALEESSERGADSKRASACESPSSSKIERATARRCRP